MQKMKNHKIKVGPITVPVRVVTRAEATKLDKNGGSVGAASEWVNTVNGWWDIETGSIFIMAHLDAPMQFKVLCHELVHAANDLAWCMEIYLAPTE
jgi:Zn-dependent peptidase ImmA (M78 family)